MGEQLHELLKHCTAIVSVDGKEVRSSGSGFFVAPGLLLTCAHVIGNEQSSPEEIEVFWNRQPDQASNKKVDVDADWTKKPYKVSHVTVKGNVDLALLRVDITDHHPCVWLAKEEAPPGEELYNFGYPFRNSDRDSDRFRGEPTTYFLEGKTNDAIGQLKFKGTNVMTGQSGSPLLIKNSGYVCAVVKKRFSSDNSFGGFAISVATVLQAFPEIETRQQLFHREDQRWMDCLWENTGLPKTDVRLRLLQSVRQSWIKPVLEEHLRQVAYILLGLSELPEAIENPLRLLKQEADQSERALLPNTTITHVYDQSIDGSLLILGEPGGGKTTLLLELARNLLERTRRDSLRSPTQESNNRHPTPVVFNLSSWAARQQSLADWLIEELCNKYDMSRAVSKSWIDNNQVLPLLDGLDEVRQNALTACVKAINTYRQEHDSLPTVVCCNRAAYFSQLARLQMHCAVVVQPLTTEQINTCLESAGPQLERLRRVCLNDPVMQELLTRPLMLNILMTIFRDMPDDEDLLTSGPLERRRQQIFAKYVQQRFKDHKDQIAKSRYTSTQAIRWLSYLAKQLYREPLKDFSVENLQPSWLQSSNKSIYYVYNWCIGSIYGLVFGLPLVLAEGGLQPPLLPSVFWLVIFGLVGGVLYPIRSIRIRPAEAITWSWKGLRSGLVTGMVIGLVIGWLYALGIVLASGGLSLIMLPTLGIDRAGSMMSELLRSVLSAGSIVGAVSAIFFGVVFGLFRGLFSKQLTVQANRLPNSGIRSSMKNGLIFGPLLCPVVGMVVAFVLWRLLGYDPSIPIYEQYYDLENVLHTGLIIGLLIGLVFGFSKGLDAFVQHYLLRFWLWRTNYLPWNLVHFLDEVARRHLLNKVVGGNYIFYHQALLEYFATLDEPASTAPKKASIFHGKLKLSLIGRLFTGPLSGPVSRIRLAWQITLRVLLALLIITTVSTVFASWMNAQTSSTSLSDQVTPSPAPTPTPPPTLILKSTPTEFPLPHPGNEFRGIVTGPDGNLWFTETEVDGNEVGRIGRITPTGKITEFATSLPAPAGITTGPDGNLWFTEEYHIGRITPSGKITEFALPTKSDASGPEGITTGPDGNLWFTEQGADKIGRITPSGKITEFALPTKTDGSAPEGITTGPDGNLWFTEWYGSEIGCITPTGKITEFALPIYRSAPEEIIAGPDGNLWFTEMDGNGVGRIGRITSSGKITEFADSSPYGITRGPGDNLWFAEFDSNKIGRITPPSTISEFTLPSTTIAPGDITFGPNATLWFTDYSNNAIGYLTSTQFNK